MMSNKNLLIEMKKKAAFRLIALIELEEIFNDRFPITFEDIETEIKNTEMFFENKILDN
ncbi:hypothetical protein [Liquorilactobacillus hordei]|uniref:hypothetical protein n=1 Tax=Liquorilactobacillus hordei TaxID=468911 RepID=UPI0039EA4AEA